MKKQKKHNWSKHLLRASGIAHIVPANPGLTDKQEATLNSYQEKDKLTEKQQATLNDLIYKRDNLELPDGVKNWLKKHFREVKYNRRAELKSKAIDKGNNNEERSITLLSILDDYEYENNKGRLNNKWLTGSCDIVPDKNGHGIDIKSSWDLSTFPFPDEKLDKLYDMQNLAYMDLYKAKSWETAYVLTNLSDSMLNDQIYREQFNWEDNEVPIWKKLEIINRFVYDNENWLRLMVLFDCTDFQHCEKSVKIFNNFTEIPLENRIIRKQTPRDNKKIKMIHKFVELGRVFLQELEDSGY